ncbi:MAG: LacI family DNA-binding transcriptional regulator [Candidatus Sumerlaeaceae bacterium]
MSYLLPDQNTIDTPATAADVAGMAGVSIYTVSRAFSGSKVVSAHTRERIFSAARKIGYTPHAAARALRTGKVATIALVQPSRPLRGEFYCDILAGLQSAASERNLDVLLSSVPENCAVESWVSNLASTGRCGAVALLTKVPEPGPLRALRRVGVPLVLLNCAADECAEQRISSVGFDNSSGVQQAVRHLEAIGHRRIAFFRCPSLWGDTLRREQGFRTCMEQVGLNVREDWMPDCPAGPPSGAAAFDQLFSDAGEKPTAIICANDDVTLGVLSAAARWGKRVPLDLSVVGHDDNTWTGYHSPTITTVRHAGWDLGYTAGELLLRLYDDARSKPDHIVLPTQLLVRESTGRPAQL